MAEPTLSEVHADLVARLEQDKRLRAVETSAASTNSTLKAMLDAQAADRLASREDRLQMEARIMGAIESAKPKLWPAVSGLAAIVAVMLTVAAAIYSR